MNTVCCFTTEILGHPSLCHEVLRGHISSFSPWRWNDTTALSGSTAIQCHCGFLWRTSDRQRKKCFVLVLSSFVLLFICLFCVFWQVGEIPQVYKCDSPWPLSPVCLSSCLDSSNVGYDSDETNARSISSLSNRSSPLSWRHGQSSPRLQAGDAPSSTGGYQGSKAASQYTAHTMPTRCSSRLSSTSRIELIEGLDAEDLKSGYLSDSDLLGKSLPDDDDDNLANG